MNVACDLDGTLAYYDEHSSINTIGNPIAPMVERILIHIKNGDTVTIFTARAGTAGQIPLIKEWCKKHIGKELEVTNIKYPTFDVFYDDKAIEIVKNTGFRKDGRHDEITWTEELAQRTEDLL